MSLLEQAIIDAQELREAALKNAETAILEKYSSDIKEAVDSMLEQDEEEDPFAEQPPMEAFGAEMAPAEEEMPEEQIPYGAAEELELCACPDEEETTVIDISFDQLKNLADELGPEGEGTEMPEEMLAAAMGAPEEEEELPLMEEEMEIDDTLLYEYDDDLEIIEEEIVVDMGGAKTGWQVAPDSVIDHEENLELASRNEEAVNAKESELEEEFEIRLAEVAKVLGEKEDLIARLVQERKSLLKSGDKIKKTFMLMKERFEEANLSNAKLLYTNRTLKSTSLNERQKNRIVESIQSAETIEEAKVIYETLQSAVGGQNNSAPKSLNEAIKRPSMSVPRRRRENSSRESAVKNRFQALAGIKK
tara:strand:+ start:415 stop:1500 length:1086 start_codon:yes stop_codon:yes gene_type:complete